MSAVFVFFYIYTLTCLCQGSGSGGFGWDNLFFLFFHFSISSSLHFFFSLKKSVNSILSLKPRGDENASSIIAILNQNPVEYGGCFLMRTVENLTYILLLYALLNLTPCLQTCEILQ